MQLHFEIRNVLFVLLVLFFLCGLLISVPAKAQYFDSEKICASPESKQKYIDELPASQRRGYYYQAIALKIALDDHIENSVEEICKASKALIGESSELTEGEAVTFSFDPLLQQEYTKHSGYDCYAGWQDECRDTIKFVASSGFIACRLDYNQRKRGRGKAEHDPKNFVYQDGQKTNKFRSYEMDFYAEGSRQIWDQWSSKLKVRDLKFFSIRENATVSQRKQRKCDIPNVSPSTPKPKTASSPASISGKGVSGKPHIFEVSVQNSSNYRTTMSYKVRVFDSDWGSSGKWLLKAHTTITVPANRTVKNQYVQYGATNWQLDEVLHIKQQGE